MKTSSLRRFNRFDAIMDLLTALPPEVSEQILQLLDVCSLCRACRVCGQWNRLVSHRSPNVWRDRCLEICTQEDVRRDRLVGCTWKEVLKKNYRKKEVVEKWLQGKCSSPQSEQELPRIHMWPMDVESWGAILECELAR